MPMEKFTYRYHITDHDAHHGDVLDRLRDKVKALGGTVDIEDHMGISPSTIPSGKIAYVDGLDVDQELRLRKSIHGLTYLGLTDFWLSHIYSLNADGFKIRQATSADKLALWKLQRYFSRHDRASIFKIMARIKAGATYVVESERDGQIQGEISFTDSDARRARDLFRNSTVDVNDHSRFGPDVLWINLAKHPDAPPEVTTLMFSKLVEHAVENNKREIVALQVPAKSGKIHAKRILQALGFVYDAELYDAEGKRGVMRLPVDIGVFSSRGIGDPYNQLHFDSLRSPFTPLFTIIDSYSSVRDPHKRASLVFKELMKQAGDVETLYKDIYALERQALYADAMRIGVERHGTLEGIAAVQKELGVFDPAPQLTDQQKIGYIKSVIMKFAMIDEMGRSVCYGYSSIKPPAKQLRVFARLNDVFGSLVNRLRAVPTFK